MLWAVPTTERLGITFGLTRTPRMQKSKTPRKWDPILRPAMVPR
jgi:hypothetical protein